MLVADLEYKPEIEWESEKSSDLAKLGRMARPNTDADRLVAPPTSPNDDMCWPADDDAADAEEEPTVAAALCTFSSMRLSKRCADSMLSARCLVDEDR